MENPNKAKRFYEIVWPHMAVVLRTASYLTSRNADGEELAQETMLKAFKSLDSLKPNSNTKAWLLTILRHAHIDSVRARTRKEMRLEEMEHEPAELMPWEPQEEANGWKNPDAVLNQFSDQNVIDAMRQLPKEIRWTLLLSDVESLDEADAAAILSVPVGTIKSRLHRGRKMLREHLAPLAREMRIGVSSAGEIVLPSILPAPFQSAVYGSRSVSSSG